MLFGVEELIDKGYKQFSTAVMPRSGGVKLGRKRSRTGELGDSEVSVTAQIPLSALAPDLEARFQALCALLVKKGVMTEAELAEALQALPARPK